MAVLFPAELGLKVMLRLYVLLGFTVTLVLPAMMKSLPAGPSRVILRSPVPLLAIFRIFFKLRFIFTLPKSRELGETEIAGTFVENAAVTAVSAFITTTRVPVPEYPPPDHPVKSEFESALALSVIFLPGLTFSVQLVPQLIPAGLLVTVPLPVPDFVTVSV